MTVTEFLKRWFASFKKHRTLDAYKRDLVDFAIFLNTIPEESSWISPGAPGAVLKAVSFLLTGVPNEPWGADKASALVSEYRNHLVKKGAAPATTNRRLAMLKGLVRSARLQKVISWELQIRGVMQVEPTDKFNKNEFGRMVGYLIKQIRKGDKKAIRDYAMLRLKNDLKLRRNELSWLNIEYADLSRSRLYVTGRQSRKRWVSLPLATKQALGLWLRARGNKTGPLFFPLSGNGTGYMRLSETSIYRTFVEISRKAK